MTFVADRGPTVTIREPPMTTIQALSPVFGHDAPGGSFSTTAHAKESLLRIAPRAACDRALIALYVANAWDERRKLGLDETQFGRVVALVRPLPMPPGQTPRSYGSDWPDYKWRGGQLR